MMSKSKFLRDADVWRVIREERLDLHDRLPPGNYIVNFHPQQGFYLSKADPFTPPPKLYGNTERVAERILSTFLRREASTGVLLEGEKGSGKTLLARTTSIIAASQHDIPTLIITSPYAGDGFFQFLASIDQPTIVFFDEFEKMYRDGNRPLFNQDDDDPNEIPPANGEGRRGALHTQAPLLTLLDGVFPSKKLFLLTCNDKWGVNSNMINRPGRVFYALKFTGLDEDFIREYAADNLKNKEHLESVVRVTSIFEHFNFDMLKALIEEMNRYGETPAQALSMLNISPEHDYATYEITSMRLASGDLPYAFQPSEVRSPMSLGRRLSVCVYYIAAASAAKSKTDLASMTIEQRSAFVNNEGKGKQGLDTRHRYVAITSADVVAVNGDIVSVKTATGDEVELTRKRYGAGFQWEMAS